jgi:hypothetical protein
MADVRESFTTLEGASQEGLALRSVQEGESVASKNGSLGFAFKDSSGNAIAPALDVSGKLPVVGPLTDAELRATAVPVSAASLPLPTGAATAANQATEIASLASIDSKLTSPIAVTFGNVTGDGKRVRGTVGGNASLTTVASLTLANSKIYEDIDFIVSCFRDALFQVILSDNGSETVIADALCGPGQLSFHGKLQEAEIATGATGTQLLLIKAQNMNALSDFRATVCVKLAN